MLPDRTLPLLSTIVPLAPGCAVRPLASVTSPLLPAVVVPLLNTSEPDTPALKEPPVPMVSAPLSERAVPLLRTTVPLVPPCDRALTSVTAPLSPLPKR